MMKLMLITNDVSIAKYAYESGVDRLFVDLEIIGKVERQGHLNNALISRHTMNDVINIRKAVPDAELLVRLNPIHSGSKDEIDKAILAGADLLMLPMFSKLEELNLFCEYVSGRAKIIPLVETPGALSFLSEIVKVNQIDEVYLGLNDLHLALGLDFMFELMTNGVVEKSAKIIKDAGLAFGFGGIARVGEGLLPAEHVLGEHVRLGSSSVILSRTFHRSSPDIDSLKAHLDFKEEIRKLIEVESRLRKRSEHEIRLDTERSAEIVKLITEKIRGKAK